MKHLSYDDLDNEDSKEFAAIVWPRIIGAVLLGLLIAGLLVCGAVAFIDMLMSVESERIKTGIVLLLIGGVSFAVLCWVAKKKI